MAAREPLLQNVVIRWNRIDLNRIDLLKNKAVDRELDFWSRLILAMRLVDLAAPGRRQGARGKDPQAIIHRLEDGGIAYGSCILGGGTRICGLGGSDDFSPGWGGGVSPSLVSASGLGGKSFRAATRLPGMAKFRFWPFPI
jgi:hypothetical protein